MAIIKSTASRPTFAGTSLYSLSDLRLGAEQALAEARAEAERLVTAAKREVERIYSESRESGFEQGKEEGYKVGLEEGRLAGEAAGRADARAEHEQVILALEQSLTAEFGRWMSVREEIMRVAERELSKIAILIAESIVRSHVRVEPAAIERQVEAAVALFARATRVAIEIAPADEALVRDALPRLCAMLPAGAEFSLRAMPGIARGGCVVRSSEGTVDARIETQFRRIREGLLGAATAADVSESHAEAARGASGETAPNAGAASHAKSAGSEAGAKEGSDAPVSEPAMEEPTDGGASESDAPERDASEDDASGGDAGASP